MIKDLNDALKAAKSRRDVFSKTIIWESGVSKSQFYRIIKGQEAPSPETKAKIVQSLGLELEQFDALFKRSKAEQRQTSVEAEPPLGRAPKMHSRLMVFGSGALLLCLIFLMMGTHQRQNPLPQNPLPQNTGSPLQTQVAVPDDKTLFIEDVTIPDGTSIPVNTTYVKTWRVQNIGNVVWKNRYLKRITPASDLICSSPPLVPIPETAPGDIVDISVTFKTPHIPGSCRTDWKTSDRLGNLFFPDMHGLFSIVTVVEEKGFKRLPN